VTQSPPFTVTGVDFAGPLYCADFPKKKLYICLFTCAVTRALHVELMDSLSLADFMMAFRRFASRRSLPLKMYSDNGAQLKGADALLKRYFGPLAPEWKFIVPLSPWWGGWWERLVRSVKSGLRKSLGRRCLTRSELETVLLEVEACINSRPLTFVSDDIDGTQPLTPSHFLIGKGAGFQARVIEDPSNVSVQSLSERARLREQCLDKFWSVWSSEYLRDLPPSVRKLYSRGSLAVGSVVLIRESGVPRMTWLMGVVTRLYTSQDDVVRSADVRTAKGMRTRAIQNLCDLELVGTDDVILPAADTDGVLPQADVAEAVEPDVIADEGDDVQGGEGPEEGRGDQTVVSQTTTRAGRTTRLPRHLKDYVLD